MRKNPRYTPKYRAAQGAPFNDDQADVYGRAIERLPGWPSVQPETVVRVAEDPRSPLHPAFEWDDRRAAGLYRKRQASNLLNHLVVIEDGAESKAYHNVSAPKGVGEARHYLHVTKIRQSPEEAGEVLDRAARELEGWLRRYNAYSQDFGRLFGTIETAVVEYREAARKAS